MATRQYIGARYVPQIMGEWDKNKGYEALSIVTYLNTSYTSKKTVPVGIEISNNEYWVATGNYNAQVEEYRQETISYKELADEINTNTKNDSFWKNKKVVIYGDSLSTNTIGPTYNNNYWDYVKENVPTIDITNRAVAGSYIYDAIALINSATDLDTFDILVLAYGTNNWALQANLNEMLEHYNAVIETTYAKNPKLNIVNILPYYSYKPSLMPNNKGLYLKDYCDAINAHLNKKGIACINLFNLSGVNEYNYKTMVSVEDDGKTYFHATQDLAKRCGYIVANANFTNAPTDSYYKYADSEGNGYEVSSNADESFFRIIGTPSFNDLVAHPIPYNFAPLTGDQSVVSARYETRAMVWAIIGAGNGSFNFFDANNNSLNSSTDRVIGFSMIWKTNR